jgi:hypothetical protein
VQIKNVLAVWEDWSLYPPLFLAGLEATFLYKATDVVRLILDDIMLDDLMLDVLII